MDEHKFDPFDPCDSLCEKIQELLKEIDDLRQDVKTDKVWSKMANELDCHSLNVGELRSHGIECDEFLN